MWPFRKKQSLQSVVIDMIDRQLGIMEHQNVLLQAAIHRFDAFRSSNYDKDDRIIALLEALSKSAPAMQGRTLLEVENRLMDIIDLMRSEPFAALKTWIDQSTTAGKKIGDMMRESRDVERQMLARWETQVRDLKEQIFLLLHAQPGCETIVPINPPQPLDLGKGV